MDAYDVILALHLLSAVALAGTITVVGVCYFRLRAAASLAQAAPWAKLTDQAGWGFPPAILGLVATGAYLTSDMWRWRTPWIAISFAGLVLVSLQGPLVAGPRVQALMSALDENGSGPLGARVRQLTRDRALWIVLFANPGVVLGIAWNMTQKPGAVGSVAAIVVGYALGAVVALPLTRHHPELSD